jgi:hypothetical protein
VEHEKSSAQSCGVQFLGEYQVDAPWVRDLALRFLYFSQGVSF